MSLKFPIDYAIIHMLSIRIEMFDQQLLSLLDTLLCTLLNHSCLMYLLTLAFNPQFPDLSYA